MTNILKAPICSNAGIVCFLTVQYCHQLQCLTCSVWGGRHTLCVCVRGHMLFVWGDCVNTGCSYCVWKGWESVTGSSADESLWLVDRLLILVCNWLMYVVDVDTRRRAACDLVRALCKSFEAPVIQIFSSYVQHMLLVCLPSLLHVRQLMPSQTACLSPAALVLGCF